MIKVGGCVFIIHHFDGEGREHAEQLAWALSLINVSAVFGEDLGGQPISVGVQRRIERADVVVVLLTGEPTRWIVEELIWAVAHHVPCLLVVKEGVRFEGGIAGDLEQINFATGEFAKTALKRVVRQVQALMSIGLDIPKTPPGPKRSDSVKVLIDKTREDGGKGNKWGEVIRAADEALLLDPNAAEAALNKAVALVQVNQVKKAERLLLSILEDFTDVEDSLLSKATYNLAQIEELRDAGNLTAESLRKQVGYLEKSKALDHKNMYARATLALCRVALEEGDAAVALVMDSIRYGWEFFKALRRVVQSKGAEGHRLLSRLPDWVYTLTFPPCDEDYEGWRFA
jgi:hypothetical protein